MKKLILILTFLFPVSSFADWTKVTSTKAGDSFYIDVKTIKESNGLVYYWTISDYLKPTSAGALSAKLLKEVNCNTPRKQRALSASYYSTPMGKGTPLVTDNKEQEWLYSQPNTVIKIMIDEACEFNDAIKEYCASSVNAESDLCINRK